MERIRWLWEIKVCLEVFASQLAVENCGREELRKLHENIAQTYEIIEAEKWDEFEGINRKFHMTVYECSHPKTRPCFCFVRPGGEEGAVSGKPPALAGRRAHRPGNWSKSTKIAHLFCIICRFIPIFA